MLRTHTWVVGRTMCFSISNNDLALAVLQTIAFAVYLQNVDVMGGPVQNKSHTDGNGLRGNAGITVFFLPDIILKHLATIPYDTFCVRQASHNSSRRVPFQAMRS